MSFISRIELYGPIDPVSNDSDFRNPLPISKVLDLDRQPILIDLNLAEKLPAGIEIQTIATNSHYELGTIKLNLEHEERSALNSPDEKAAQKSFR